MGERGDEEGRGVAIETLSGDRADGMLPISTCF